MQERAALTITINAITLRSYLVALILPSIPYAVAFNTIQRLAVATTFLIVLTMSMTEQRAIAQEPTRPAINGTGGDRVVLASSTHPAARAASDLGRVAGNLALDRMLLVLASSESQEHGLRELLDNLHLKGSPRYPQWLTPEEFRVEFRASPDATQKVVNWLAAQGFSIDRVGRGGRWIQFSGTAAQVEAAFATEMHRYQTNGTAHIANASDLSLPAQVAPLVSSVL